MRTWGQKMTFFCRTVMSVVPFLTITLRIVTVPSNVSCPAVRERCYSRIGTLSSPFLPHFTERLRSLVVSGYLTKKLTDLDENFGVGCNWPRIENLP